MAIERQLRTEIVFPLGKRSEVLDALHRTGLMHLDPPGEEAIGRGASAGTVAAGKPEEYAAALAGALEIVEEHFPPRKTLMQSFFGVPLAATRAELRTAARQLDAAAVGAQAAKLRERWRRLARFDADARAELEALEPFLGLPFTGRDLAALRRVKAVLGVMPEDGFNDLRLDPEADFLGWEEVRRRQGKVWALAGFRPADGEAAWERLRAHGFEETPFPRLAGTAEERAAALRRDLERAAEERAEVRRAVGRLASDRRQIELALAHWEDQREIRDAARNVAEFKRSGLLAGYVQERDRAALEALLAGELAGCEARFSPPAVEEDVPVAIRLPAWLKPMQLLINMFGLPHYRSFDPTAYLTLSYLVFFGCCFGDVAYGLGLCALSYGVMRRYRHSWVKGFFQFFFYAGIFSAFFGLLTGTWMGDLVSEKYMSAGNALVRLRNACMVLDPLAKPLLALALSLVLGIVNQFYGIILKMLLEIRRRDYLAAVFDAGLWLLFLPGLLIAIIPMFQPLPAAVTRTGYWLLGGSALGLVLTQGRREKGLLAKAITGLVSLYGILGSYGATGFIGDVLSYSRLLALGLTTTIIGMSVNILAGMVVKIPYGLGLALAAVFFLGGHALNFVMSILGSFVHPARLVLLEFFNRFYESGGRAFRPLSFRSGRVEIVKGGDA